MRVTRETLLKIVQDTVDRRTRADRSLLAIYMHGSILEEDYLLGGAGDIDLFIVHNEDVPAQREIVHLTDEIHLDIAHTSYRGYRQTRQLRIDPWIGPTLKNCKILFDPQHMLDFTQASVRGQFERPDYTLERVRRLASSARQAWLSFHQAQLEPGPAELRVYLDALGNAANAVISLDGMPLTERRFLLNLPLRAEMGGRPGLYPGFLGLLGANHVDQDAIQTWLPSWQSAYLALPAEAAFGRLHPARLLYYLNAFNFMLAKGHHQAALWPLLRTWTLAVEHLPESYRADWRGCAEQLGLLGKSFNDRVAGLDAYLDSVEETLDQWATANGAVG